MKRKKMGVVITSALVVAGIGFIVFYFGGTASKAAITKVEAEKIISSQYPGSIEGDIQKEDNNDYYVARIAYEGKQYEIKIHEKTGEVLQLNEVSTENKDDPNASVQKENNARKETENGNQASEPDKQQENNTGQKVVISEEEAKKLALDEFAGTLDDLELDEDDGRFVYEVKIVHGQDEAEITIDAFTGEILFKEIERED
ncbi:MULTISPECIES: PepSY domain-containing protein [Clostridia]|uniref:PepSY domain-containing protein n=1 Tax=Clostridia TaxID=186801 RepID=UPI000EA19FF4|nr:MULTISPECIES: PepSY domain-containing protein [Clostridia]NBJ71221.1 hypothetical protein [Roseburia sp. 1XD42-34]RKI74964.1 hypothetical protein D7V87_17535 [Clostridium sp. 1xD42-85]